MPARSGRGYSKARPRKPSRMLMVWRMGMGFTALSRFLVRKSKKIFGQKKDSREAAIWSVGGGLVGC